MWKSALKVLREVRDLVSTLLYSIAKFMVVNDVPPPTEEQKATMEWVQKRQGGK